MAKMKLKELESKAFQGTTLEEELYKLPEVIRQMKKIAEEKENVIIYDNFFDDGKDQTILRCGGCGHSWIITERMNYSYYSWRRQYSTNSEECPCCHNKYSAIRPNSRIKDTGEFIIIRSYDNENQYAVISSMTFAVSHKADGYSGYDGKDLSHFENNQDVKILSCCDSIMSFNYGLRPHYRLTSHSTNSSSDLLSANSSEFISAKYKLFNGVFIENAISRKIFNDFSEQYEGCESAMDIIKRIDTEIIEKKEKKAEAAAATRKKNDTTPEYASYKGKEIEDSYLIERYNETEGKAGSVISLIYSDLGGIKKTLSSCSCGNIFHSEIGSEYRHEITCPKCQAKDTSYSIRKEETTYADAKAFVYELVETSGEILLRVFNFRRVLSFSDESVSYNIKESYRFFIGEKGIKCFEKYGENWEKGRVNMIDNVCGNYWNSTRFFLCNTNEEMEEIIKNSILKYSGLLEAWGLKKSSDGRDLSIEDIGKISRSSYIYTWIKNKAIEQVLKTGLVNAAKDILSQPDSSDVNASGKTVFEILDINKAVYRIIRERNSNLREINQVRRVYNLDNTITAKDYADITAVGNTDMLINISQQFGVPFKKQIEYIDSCYNNQCIERNEALRIWFDYLKMATDMEYRLNDTTHKFPGSLKKEHDRAQFSYKVVQDEMNTKRFIAQAEINKAALEYSFENLFVKVPMNPNEVIQEGTDQKHCVASYVSRIRDGSTAVCFIRKKEQPDVAYYTVEVCNGEIVQVRGYCNCAPTGTELITFIKKWAERKHLKARY